MSRQKFGTNKDVKKLIRRAQRQGWAVEIDGSNHIKVKPPGKAPFRLPLTTANRSRITHATRQFQEAGLR